MKPQDEYLNIMQNEKSPLFNFPLFYSTLENKVDPEQVPLFNLAKDVEKRFEGLIPNPDETWSQLFKRILKFEIQKPPLVDRDSVPIIKRSSTYMKMQSKLMEYEYVGAKVELKDKDEKNVSDGIKENDIEMNIVSSRKENGEKEEDKEEKKENKELLNLNNESSTMRHLKEDEHSQRTDMPKPELKIEVYADDDKDKPNARYGEHVSSSFASEYDNDKNYKAHSENQVKKQENTEEKKIEIAPENEEKKQDGAAEEKVAPENEDKKHEDTAEKKEVSENEEKNKNIPENEHEERLESIH